MRNTLTFSLVFCCLAIFAGCKGSSIEHGGTVDATTVDAGSFQVPDGLTRDSSTSTDVPPDAQAECSTDRDCTELGSGFIGTCRWGQCFYREIADAGTPDVQEDTADTGSVCVTNEDCPNHGLSSCVVTLCQRGECFNIDVDGASCDDGDSCTDDGVCAAGECLVGEEMDCPTGCTAGECNDLCLTDEECISEDPCFIGTCDYVPEITANGCNFGYKGEAALCVLDGEAGRCYGGECTVPPEFDCTIDSECGDTNDCTIDSCVEGECVNNDQCFYGEGFTSLLCESNDDCAETAFGNHCVESELNGEDFDIDSLMLCQPCSDSGLGTGCDDGFTCSWGISPSETGLYVSVYQCAEVVCEEDLDCETAGLGAYCVSNPITGDNECSVCRFEDEPGFDSGCSESNPNCLWSEGLEEYQCGECLSADECDEGEACTFHECVSPEDITCLFECPEEGEWDQAAIWHGASETTYIDCGTSWTVTQFNLCLWGETHPAGKFNLTNSDGVWGGGTDAIVTCSHPVTLTPDPAPAGTPGETLGDLGVTLIHFETLTCDFSY